MTKEIIILEKKLIELEINKADEVTPMLFEEPFFLFFITFFFYGNKLRCILIVNMQICGILEHKVTELESILAKIILIWR